jgi:hypothetical protein
MTSLAASAGLLAGFFAAFLLTPVFFFALVLATGAPPSRYTPFAKGQAHGIPKAEFQRREKTGWNFR